MRGVIAQGYSNTTETSAWVGATPLRLRGPFIALVLLLLLAVSASTIAGWVGLGHLDRAMRELAEQDAQRLVTVTHVRRLFRSEVVLANEIADLANAALPAREREALLERREALREERAVLLERLRSLGVVGQDEALLQLRRDHEEVAKHGTASATQWENAVAAILGATQERLNRASLDARRKSESARIGLLVASGLAATVAFALSALVLRRVRHASEALAGREAQIRTVIQSAPSLLTVVSKEGKLMFLPPRGPGFLGMPADQVARDPLCWVAEEDRELIETQISEAASGCTQSPTVRVRGKRCDGAEWHATTSSAALYGARHELSGVVLQILDVTSRVKAERAQVDLEEQLRHAQKMDSVGRLAGGIAHDFNNLLTAIRGFATMAKEEPHSPEVPEFLDSILVAGDRATELTRQLLTFSRKHAISPAPTDLGALLKGIEKLLIPVLGEDVRLEIKIDPDLGLCLVDKNQVEQAVMNLAINARHAMPKGGRLLFEAKNAELDEGYIAKHPGAIAGAYVLLSVSDTGVGMSKEVQQRAFEPFFTTKPVGQGTGLGLSVVHGTVHQHGGSIDLYSEPGVGTTFRLYWPRVPSSSDAACPVESLRGTPGGSELVLLVEDEFLVRTFAVKALARLGYRVLAAESAHEALQLMQHPTETPRLFLLDVILPDMTGPELAMQLRTAIHRDVPVLYASGYSGKLMTERGHLPAGVEYMQKPYDAVTLARRVREVIDHHRGSSGAPGELATQRLDFPIL